MEIPALYSNRVWLDDQLQAATILLANGQISSIIKGKKLQNAKDFGDAVIMPGVIDAHVHINEPGRTTWEGFSTATKAAARGGITTLVDMPLNSSPVVTNVAAFNKKISSAQGKLRVNCGFWAGAIDANSSNVESLLKAGCLGVKVFLSHSGIDEFPNISLSNLDQLMVAIQPYQVPILAHCELDTLAADNSLAEQPTSYQAYLKSRPRTWEDEAIKAFTALGKKHKCPIHIVHLSSSDSIQKIREEKANNPLLTVETCPHYLLFEAESIADGNTLFKCAPPIREKENNEQLKTALKTGLIDFITTDHSPAPPNIKELESGNFQKAWGGIAGLQFLLSASWTALQNHLDLATFIPLLTSQPAQFLGLAHQIGCIKEGYQADLTIWKPEASFLVKEESIEHRHKKTPYLGQELYGKVQEVIVNGKQVFADEKVTSELAGKVLLKT
jgi:allantoinase